MPFEGAFSPVHWLIIAVVALVVLGPERLPDAARKVARAWREFQDGRTSIVDQVDATADPGTSDSDADERDPPDEMSDLARQVGGAMREFRRAHHHLRAELGDVASGPNAAPSTPGRRGGDRVPVLPAKPDSADAETTTKATPPDEPA